MSPSWTCQIIGMNGDRNGKMTAKTNPGEDLGFRLLILYLIE